MNSILVIGPRGGAPSGLVLIFLLIWAASYFYGSWKQRENIVLTGRTDKIGCNDWNQKIFRLIVGLIGLFLPMIKGLFRQNTAGSGGFEKSFEEYSSQVALNLILFLLLPFIISAIIMAIRKEFPTRIFNNLVIVMVVLVLFVFTLNTFQHWRKRTNTDNRHKICKL